MSQSGKNFGVPVANIIDGAVADFNPQIDYFPEKNHDSLFQTVANRISQQLQISYRQHSRQRRQSAAIFAGSAWNAAPDGFSTECGQSKFRCVIFALMNWQHGALVDILGLHDKLLGVDDFKSYTTPGIVKLIEERKIVNTNYGF